MRFRLRFRYIHAYVTVMPLLMLVSMLMLTLTAVVSWGAWTQDAASLRSQLDDARRAAADTKEVRAPRHAATTAVQPCVCVSP